MDREDIEDFFAPFSYVRLRRMFSGYGVYVEDACFALVLSGEILIKADAAMQESLAAVGSEPFVYKARGREITVKAFWSLPQQALDDDTALKEWCALALVAAQKTAREKAWLKMKRAHKISNTMKK